MKWVVGAIAVISAFVIGFACGWVVHHPQVESVRSVATSTASIVEAAPTIIAPVVSAAPLASEDDAGPFAWPTTAAPAHDVMAVDATHYVVDADFLADFRRDPSKLLRTTRIVQEYVDGGVVGLRIFGVRADTDVAKLGIENGDRIETLNGLPLIAPDTALEGYNKLAHTKTLALVIVRRGAPMTLHYLVTGRGSFK